MSGFLWNVLSFIVALGVLVTIHEFGHFWVARRCGVFVERFSIGFGKALWRRTDKKGTEYVIAMIPLGGYVKMLDGRVDQVPEDKQSQAFDNKIIAQRAAVIAAGPIANFIFAAVAYWVVFMIGVPGIKPVIESVKPNSIAAQAHLPVQMELKAINGIKVSDWEGVRQNLAAHIGDKNLTLTLAKPGSSVVSDKIIDISNWSVALDKEDPISSLGIVPVLPKVLPVMEKVEQGSAAQRSGLLPGDEIVLVNNSSYENWQDFAILIRDNPERAIALQIKRSGELKNIELVPDAKMQKGTKMGFAGLQPRVEPLPENYKILKQYGPLDGIVEAVSKTADITLFTVKMLGKLITGNVSLDSLSGPLSIAQGAGASAGFGLIYFLMFLALLSVNLGVINLFPLPVLDGGHLVFLLVEKIKGSPVSENVQGMFYRVGAMALFMLMGLAIFNDISRL